MSRADAFIAKGRVLQGMDMSLMGAGCEPKLCRIPISVIGVELGEAVRGIRPEM